MGIKLDTFANKEFRSFLPKEKTLVVLMVNCVAVEESIDVDMSQVPHQWTGLCRHCINVNFNTYDDAVRLVENLNSDNVDSSKVHVAAEAFSIGLIHKTCTTIVPIAVSPTCKKDEFIGQSTHTVLFFLDGMAQEQTE